MKYPNRCMAYYNPNNYKPHVPRSVDPSIIRPFRMKSPWTDFKFEFTHSFSMLKMSTTQSKINWSINFQFEFVWPLPLRKILKHIVVYLVTIILKRSIVQIIYFDHCFRHLNDPQATHDNTNKFLKLIKSEVVSLLA